MSKAINYSRLPTEQNNPASKHIDRLSIPQVLRLINKEDAKIARAVSRQIPNMAKAVQIIVNGIKSGGRLFFIGAGTSGRLGVMEAAECPPTFSTPPSLVQAFMAGGRSSVFRSKEGAEDNGLEAARIINRRVCEKDVVVGIAASGVTPFVREGLRSARKKGAKTVLVTCYLRYLGPVADIAIQLNTGAEVIAGSTRLKAATATKLVLNSLTVASMIQLGKVYGHWMVDLQPRSKKLEARAERLVSLLGRVSYPSARTWLQKSGGNAKTAILMAKRKIARPEAIRRLKRAHGHLHKALTLDA